MAGVEQMNQIAPFLTCEITFSQNVCKLVFGVDILDLNVRIHINSVKQPIQSNSVGPWYVSHCGTSASQCYHLNHGFIVLKNVEHRTKKRRLRIRRNIINITQFKIVVLGWNFGFGCAYWMWCYATSFLVLDLWVFFEWFGEEWQISITKSQRSRAGIPSMRKPALRDMSSVLFNSVRPRSVFFAHPTFWHELVTSENAQERVHQMLILSLQGLLQNQNLETILICIVVLCYPHNSIDWIHMCDEWTRSDAPNVCHKLLSILWPHKQVYSQTIKCRVYQYEPKKTF